MKKKPQRKTFVISYDNVEAAIIQWMYSTGTLGKDKEVIDSYIPIECDKKGLTTFTLSLINQADTELPYEKD